LNWGCGKGWPSRRLKNPVAAIIYFAGVHAFDALYALTCKEFSYFASMGIMLTALAGVSIVLIELHEWIGKRTGWDVIGLESLNRLRDVEDNPPARVGRRIKRWCMRRRLTIFIFGSCLVGPPVVTILLRRPGRWVDNVFYILSGTLISVVTWVTVWKGFWNFWATYIKPAVHWIA